MNKKIWFFTLSFLLLFNFNTEFVLAQTHVGSTYSGPEAQIKQFLCTPSDASTSKDKASNDLYNCINRIYRFALVTASFFAVFMIVLAGWVYMSAEGNEESVTKAKDILVTSIASIVILSSGYVLLKFINPDLIQFQPIQPPSVVGVERGYSFDKISPELFKQLFIDTERNLRTSTGQANTAYTETANYSVRGQNLLQIAQSQIGAKEDCCTASGEGKNSSKAIDKYFIPGGSPGQPWCMYFTSWVYGQAGYTSIGNLSGRGGWPLQTFFVNNHNKTITDGQKQYTVKFVSKDEIIKNPNLVKAGDIAFFKRGKVGSGEGHAAIVKNYNSSNKEISTIDGNISNAVKEQTRSINTVCRVSGENGVCEFIGVGQVIDK